MCLFLRMNEYQDRCKMINSIKLRNSIISKLLAALVLILTFASGGTSQENNDKDSAKWKTFKTPEKAGFSSSKLLDAKTYWDDLRPRVAATMIIYKGKVLVSWGDTQRPYMCHSIRKSYLSSLYGIHVKEGHIDLQKTMADLGIDDMPPLTEAEKQAKVIHLLKARSGIYHEAAYEAPSMKESRPPRGSHPPDTFWYYNNWDLNALGTIFEQETDTKIFEEYKARIADPIGMQDFKVEDCYYHYEWDLSIHPAYPFQISARDRARFGLLFLQEGRWDDLQIISKKWIKESTKAYSDVSIESDDLKGFGYGYMWWTLAKYIPVFQQSARLKDMGAAYFASGYKGHLIIVMPAQEMVFVQVVDTFQGLSVSEGESFLLLDMILTAREFDIFDLAALKTWFGPKTMSRGEIINLSARIRNLSRKTSHPTQVDFYLSENSRFNQKDIYLGNADLPGIKAGRKKSVKLKTRILDTITPGSYYLIAYVDRDDVNSDPWPRNNSIVSQQKVIVH